MAKVKAATTKEEKRDRITERGTIEQFNAFTTMGEPHALLDNPSAKTLEGDVLCLQWELWAKHMQVMAQRWLFEMEGKIKFNRAHDEMGNKADEARQDPRHTDARRDEGGGEDDTFHDARSKWFHCHHRHPHPHKTHKGGGVALHRCRSQASFSPPMAGLSA
jgi:hypothetical protein